MQTIQKEVAPISYLYMVDNKFTAKSTAMLKAFCDRYQAEIEIPFFVHVNPLIISEEKMEILLNTGYPHIAMGIESVSERTAELYKRNRSHKALLSVIVLVEKYRSKMSPPPTYQFIIDNPYETLKDILKTLRLAFGFLRLWHKPIYSLMLFPGVPLYKRAMKDGIINNKFSKIYSRNWGCTEQAFFSVLD